MSKETLNAMPSCFSKEFAAVFTEKLGKLKNEKTVSLYLHTCEALCSASGKDFLELTRQDVLSYFQSPAVRSKKRNSRAAWMRILRAVARFTDERLGTDNLGAFSVPVEGQTIHIEASDLPKPEEIDKVLSQLKEEGDEELFLIIALVLETGLWTGEICTLTLGNFVLDTKGQAMIRIAPEVEEGFFRNIPLTHDTAALIASHGLSLSAGQKKSTDRFFTNAYGNPISERVLQKRLRDACLRAEVEPFSLTELRNLAVASMMQGGATADLLSYQLGITDTWFFRLNHAVEDLPKQAASYSHLRVIW